MLIELTKHAQQLFFAHTKPPSSYLDFRNMKY